MRTAQPFETFESLKDSYIEKYIKYKTITINPNKRQPWFTKGLKKSRHTLATLKKKILKTPKVLNEYKTYKTFIIKFVYLKLIFNLKY